MPKIALTIAVLAAHAVWTEQANWRLHRRNKRLKHVLTAQAQTIERLQTLAVYFGDKLDENEVELDEFDMIAIHNM